MEGHRQAEALPVFYHARVGDEVKKRLERAEEAGGAFRFVAVFCRGAATVYFEADPRD